MRIRLAELITRTLCLQQRDDARALTDEWRRAPITGLGALIAYEGGAQWALRQLTAIGALESAPAAFVAGLRNSARDDAVRHMMIDAEAEGLLHLLASRGTPCVLLKGTARRAAVSLYPMADARRTSDVDVLLPAAHVAPTWEHLRDAGWSFHRDPLLTPAEHFHPPPLRGPNRVGVELHSSTSDAVPAEEAWRRATSGACTVAWRGLSVRIPDATELLWHAIAHAAVHGVDGFRLRYFLDGAVILASRQEIDWDRIVARLENGEAGDIGEARAWLHASAQLAGVSLAGTIGAAAQSFDVTHELRWRLAVLKRLNAANPVAHHLINEGTRGALGARVAAPVQNTGLLARSRRRVGARVARAVYMLWRA